MLFKMWQQGRVSDGIGCQFATISDLPKIPRWDAGHVTAQQDADKHLMGFAFNGFSLMSRLADKYGKNMHKK